MPRRGQNKHYHCPSCGGSIWISQVVSWPVANRLYWFLSGLCLKCQAEE